MTKDKVTFDKWFREVNIIDNLQDVDVSGANETDWRILYGMGMTPAEAFTKMVKAVISKIADESPATFPVETPVVI